MMRATLAPWVNSNLGRIENAAARIASGTTVPAILRACAAYIEFYNENPSFILHNTYKTPEEKAEAARIKRNAAARKRRAENKVSKQIVAGYKQLTDAADTARRETVQARVTATMEAILKQQDGKTAQ